MLITTAPPVGAPTTSRRCESCGLRPALLALAWPDTRFELCQDCVPPKLLAAAAPLDLDRPPGALRPSTARGSRYAPRGPVRW